MTATATPAITPDNFGMTHRRFTTREGILRYARIAQTGDMIAVELENGGFIYGPAVVTPGTHTPTVTVNGFEVASEMFNNLTNYMIDALYIPRAA